MMKRMIVPMLLALGIMSTALSCKDDEILKQKTKIEKETYYAKVGEEITLKLDIENEDPQGKYTWFFEGKEIGKGKELKYSNNTTGDYRITVKTETNAGTETFHCTVKVAHFRMEKDVYYGFVKEELKLKLVALNNGDGAQWTWSIDGKNLQGNGIESSFTPEEAKDYTLKVTGVYQGKSVEISTVIHAIHFTAAETSVKVEEGEAVLLKIEGHNTTDLKETYAWKEGEKELGTEASLKYEGVEVGKHTVTATISGVFGEKKMEFSVNVVAGNPYANAVLVLDPGFLKPDGVIEGEDKYPSVDVITRKGVLIRNIIQRENPKLTPEYFGPSQLIKLIDNRLYLISQDYKLFTFDAMTMKQIGNALEIKEKSRVYRSLEVTPEGKAFIASSKTLYSLNLTSGDCAKITDGDFSIYAPFESINGTFYAISNGGWGTTTKIVAIDAKTAKITKEIEFGNVYVSGGIITKDEKLVAVHGRSAFSSPSQFTVISLKEDNKIVSKGDLPTLSKSFIVPYPGEDAFVFSNSRLDIIYKYNYTHHTLQRLANVPSYDEASDLNRFGINPLTKKLFVLHEVAPGVRHIHSYNISNNPPLNPEKQITDEASGSVISMVFNKKK